MIQRSMNELYGKSKYRIHLFEVKDNIGNHIWSGSTASERNIVIIRINNNFDVPRNLNKLLKKSFFCFDCLAMSCLKHRHRCNMTCRSCGESIMICNSTEEGFTKQCEDCKIFYLSKQCYERHRKKQRTVQTDVLLFTIVQNVTTITTLKTLLQMRYVILIRIQF